MQDRLRFRAWDNKNSKYIYDVQDTYDDSWCECFGYMFDCICYENRFVVEQCTGLKDKNGKLIYEGDKIQAETVNGLVKHRVEWNEKQSCFQAVLLSDNLIICRLSDEWCSQKEVYGDIHGNLKE